MPDPAPPDDGAAPALQPQLTDVRGFFHICCLGTFREVVREIVHALLESRLYERCVSIDVGILGSAADQEYVEALLKPFPRFRILLRSTRLTDYEFPTLGLLQDCCQTWDGPVFYVHTKGVSRSPHDHYSRYWRQLMLDEVVYNHQQCLDELLTADAVGTNWFINHYSGNFWWARPAHIRALPEIRSAQEQSAPGQPTAGLDSRMPCEFWLTQRPGTFAIVGLSGNLNLYDALRWSTSVADVVNDLLSARTRRRFAEVCTRGPSQYFNTVIADSRVSISDVAQHVSVDNEMTSTRGPDNAEYDVVLIEARYEPTDCLNVIEQCLSMLTVDGVLVVHYTNPPSAWHQRPAEEANGESEWSGQVWRAIVQYRLRYPHHQVLTVDTDYGCTLIRPSRSSHPPAEWEGQLDWTVFVDRRSDLLGLISVPQFRRSLFADRWLAGQVEVRNSIDVSNLLIAGFGLDTYLAVGTDRHQDLRACTAPIRQSIAEDHDATFCAHPSEFFAHKIGLDRYDLIAIDCGSNFPRTEADLELVLDRLTIPGFIVACAVDASAEHFSHFVSMHPELDTYRLELGTGCVLVRRHAPGHVAELSSSATPVELLRRLVTSRPVGNEPRRNQRVSRERPGNLIPQSYASDRELLLAEVKRNPNDVRAIFHLAQSYFAAGEFGDARSSYAQQLALRKPWWPDMDQEFYIAMYRLASSMAHLNEPWPAVREAYLDAVEFRGRRAEAAYELAFHYRVQSRFELGYAFAKLAAETPFPADDTICVGIDIYQYLAADEQAVCAYWLGRHEEAFALCRGLIARSELPEPHRSRIAVNRDHSAPAMIEAALLGRGNPREGALARPNGSTVTVTLLTGADPLIFENSLVSFLNCCNDLIRVESFIAFDTGLSTEGRAELAFRFPFIEFASYPTRNLLPQIRRQVHTPHWLHLGVGWRFFAPENLITRLIGVLEAEQEVFQVGVNYTDADRLIGRCAAEAIVQRTPMAGRYVRTTQMASGPALFDVERLDRAHAEQLGAATLDEVLCVLAT